MELVNILDIDGYKWDLTDTQAREKVAVLEQKTDVKITNVINENNLLMNVVEINGEKFIQVKIKDWNWHGEAGELLANFRSDFGLQDDKRFFVNLSGSSGREVGFIYINKEGEIRFYPCFANDLFPAFRGHFIYGETFLRVNDF